MISSTAAYRMLAVSMIKNLLNINFSLFLFLVVMDLNDSKKSFTLNNIRMSPSKNGKTLGPTSLPYALVAICLLSNRKAAPIIAKITLAYRSKLPIFMDKAPFTFMNKKGEVKYSSGFCLFIHP